MCKCKAKFWLLGAVALAALVVIFRCALCGPCKAGGPGARPASPAGAPPAQPQGAAAATQAQIEERMADTNYVAGLNQIATRFDELNALRRDAVGEFAEWQRGFLSSNEQARALAIEVAKTQEGGAPGSAQSQLEALFRADERGAALLDKIAKIDEAIEGNRRIAADYVSARVRNQGGPASKPLTSDGGAARPQRGPGAAEAPASPPPVRKAPAGMPEPRKEGWWTNAPLEKARGV